MASGTDSIRGKPIEVLQRLDAGPVTAGDGSERVSAHDPVAHPVRVLLPGRLLRKPRRELPDGVGGELQPVRAPRIGRPALEPRVEPAELIERDAGEIRRDAEVHLAVESDLLKIRTIGDRFQDHAVTARVLDDGGDREQAGDVGPRLPGQLQRPDVHRLASRTIPGDRPPDVAFAPVVGGDREQPVSVEVLQELREVVQRGTGGRHDVAAPVVPPVLLESVPPSGRRHELPQARRARR